MKLQTQKCARPSRAKASGKNTLVYATALLSVAATLSASAAMPLLPAIPAFRTSMVNVETPEFRLATKLPNIPAAVPLMETTTPDAEEQLLKVAETLGLDLKMAANGKGKLATRHLAGEHEQQTLTMFEASAGFFYRYDNLLNAIPKQQAELPKDGDAYEIALDYLRQHDLLPRDVLLNPEDVKFSRPELSQFDAKSGKTLQHFTTSVEVRFEQQWVGIPVTGPGAKLYVAIGDQGKVLGLNHMLRSAVESGVELKTITPERALEGLRKGRAQLALPAGCRFASVESMTLAYWSESPRNSQRNAIPLYDISGSCEDLNGQSLGSFQAYTAAVLQPTETPESNPRHEDYEQDVDG